MKDFDIKDTIISLFKRRKGSVKNVGYYFLASFILMLFNLILSPIYSLYLSAEDFAIIGYYTSFSGLLGPLIIFYMNQYYMREYYFCKDNWTEFMDITSSYNGKVVGCKRAEGFIAHKLLL